MRAWPPVVGTILRPYRTEVEWPGQGFVSLDRARFVLWKAQDGRCSICNGRMANQRGHASCKGARISLEHVIPRAHGGLDLIGNLLVAHEGCNAEKGDNMPTGCELVLLLAVNARLVVNPQRW